LGEFFPRFDIVAARFANEFLLLLVFVHWKFMATRFAIGHLYWNQLKAGKHNWAICSLSAVQSNRAKGDIAFQLVSTQP